MQRKPLVPCDLTPTELIGMDDYEFIKKHFNLSLKVVDPEKFDNMMKKKFNEKERTLVAEIYKKLREFGVWPKGIDRHGEIKWGIALRGDLQNYTESMPEIPRRNFPLSVEFKKMPELSESYIVAENY
jgi:hypothetical protein